MNENKATKSPLSAIVSGFSLSLPEKQLVGIVLFMKAALLLFGMVLHEVFYNKKLTLPRGILETWSQWDSPKYVNIARFGYQTVGDARFHIVFYPGYPYLISAGMLLGLSALVSSFLVVTIASAFVAVLLFRLARLDFPAKTAFRAVFLLFVFPTAYFLHVNMTESPFLAFALGAFLAARQRHWGVAGILGLGATLIRMNGLVLILALLIEALCEWRETKSWNRRWIALLLPPIGVLFYLYLNYALWNNPFQFMIFQREHWNHHLAGPWAGAWNALTIAINKPPATAEMVGNQEFLALLIGLIASVVCLMRTRLSYGVWVAGNWLLVTSMDFLTSTPRYLLLFFPMFLLLGRATKNPLLFGILTYGGLLFYALFAAMYVQGGWAF